MTNGNAARWAELDARPVPYPIPDRCRGCSDCAVSTEGVRPCPAHVTTQAIIERSKLVNCQPGQRDPGWLYQTTGPDGTRFDNRSIVELRSVLRRKYGKTIKITEPWKGETR